MGGRSASTAAPGEGAEFWIVPESAPARRGSQPRRRAARRRTSVADAPLGGTHGSPTRPSATTTKARTWGARQPGDQSRKHPADHPSQSVVPPVIARPVTAGSSTTGRRRPRPARPPSAARTRAASLVSSLVRPRADKPHASFRRPSSVSDDTGRLLPAGSRRQRPQVWACGGAATRALRSAAGASDPPCRMPADITASRRATRQCRAEASLCW